MRIYLDHNATTPLDPRAAAAMAECAQTHFANPSSQHRRGRQARQALEDAREEIAELLGARLTGSRPDRLIFTSGGTEANNLAIYGLAGARAAITAASAIEHPSITAAVQRLAEQGRTVTFLPATVDGVIDLNVASERLRQPSAVVSVLAANHETGARQPLAELVRLKQQHGFVLHTDATQAVGKIPLDFRELGVDALTCTAHKLHGPRGIGVLLLRHGVTVEPQVVGGFQQEGLRCGTECTALVVGMATALRLWHAEAESRQQRMTQLRLRLERALVERLPDAVIHAAHAPRLPNTVNVSLPGVDRQALLMALDMDGVECSTGSACASGSSEPSPTLRAMGLDDRLVSSSLRLSLGASTTDEEITAAAERIAAAAQRVAAFSFR
jgi:cysteine desulfurase